MKKTRIATHLSLRCKFKNPDTVEVTVVDLDTGETTQILWQFRQSQVITEGCATSTSESSDVESESQAGSKEESDEDD